MKIQALIQFRPVALPGALLCGVLLLASALSALPAGAQEPGAGDPAPASATPSTAPGVPTGVFTEVMNVRVVNVDVFVTDSAGLSVTGLKKEDFVLKVDGRVMAISNFYAEARALEREAARSIELQTDSSFRTLEEVAASPARRAHVLILVDHTRLRFGNRRRAFAALREAVEALDREDLIAVAGVEGGLVFYSDFLYDRQAIGRILDRISSVAVKSDVTETERRLLFGELARGQSGGILARGLDPGENAILARIQSYAAQEYARSVGSLRHLERVIASLAGVPGQKAVLYLGEGVPTRPGEGLYVEWRNRYAGTGTELGLRRVDFNDDYIRAVGKYDLTAAVTKVAAAANHAGVTLYSVDAEGDHGGEIRSALTEQGSTSESQSFINENYRAPLEYTTKATGGLLLRSSGLLADQLVDLIRDFDTYYSLGFTAPEDWGAGSEHKIEIKVKAKGMIARHREEVRLPKADEREAGATVAALMYETVDNPLGIRALPGERAPGQDGTVTLPVRLEIPVADLGFLPQGDSQAGSLTIYVSTKSKDGSPGKVQKIPFHLAIPDDKMEEAKADSAHYPLALILRPGDRQVAIGIRDNVNGTFSALRLDVSEFSPAL